MTIKCDKCGDESNSAPGLICGRVEIDEDTGTPITEPCTGTYHQVPTVKQMAVVLAFRTNPKRIAAGGEVTYEMQDNGDMVMRATKDVDGKTRITQVPPDGHYGLIGWED